MRSELFNAVMNSTPPPHSASSTPPPPQDLLRLFDHSRGFAIILLSPEGIIVQWNLGAETLLGYRKDEIVGAYFSKLFRSQDQADGMPERELEQARVSEIASDENWLVRKDGSAFWASGATTALKDENGVLRGFAKMTRDASERKQLRAALTASEQKFQTTVSQIKDHAIFSTNADGHISTWNEGCEQVLGYAANEALGADARGLLDIDGVVTLKAQFEMNSAAERGSYVTERPVLRKGGERFWASVITAAIRDNQQALIGYTIVLRDLTERRRADEAVRSSMARLQLISDTAHNLLITDDPLALLDRVYDQLLGSVDLDLYFHFIGTSPDKLQLQAYRGVEPAVAEQMKALGRAPMACRTAAENRAPCVLSDVQQTSDPKAEFVRELGITAYACYPLIADDKLWGTLSFGSREIPAFGAEVVDVFATVSNLFSEAIARRAMTSALTSREAQLGAVLEGAPSGLLMLDSASKIVMANAHAELIFGYKRAELLGLPCERLVENQDRTALPILDSLVDPAPGVSSIQRHEVAARRRDGSVFPAEVWLNSTGSPEHRFTIAAFVDITARREVEHALRENEQKLRFLNELGDATRELRDPVQIMAVSTRAIGEHLRASRCAYADVEPDEEKFTIPQDYSAGLPSSRGTYQLSQFGKSTAALLRRGEVLVLRNVSSEMAGKDGRSTFQSIQIEAIICCPLIKEGRIVAMMAIHQQQPRDWTAYEVELMRIAVERCWSTIERAKAEQALQRNEERLQLAMEAGRLGMWQYDHATREVSFDHRIAEFYELPPNTQKMSVDHISGLVHPEDRDRVVSELVKAAEMGAHFDVEFRISLPGGKVRWIAAKGDAVKGPSGEFTHVIGVNYDLTARKKGEEELHEAQAALRRHAYDLEIAVAERTAKLRETVSELERFSYSLSHDMRAPLRAMQGFSQILEEEYGGKLDSEGRGYLRRIAAASRRLDQLIRDVLSYTHVVREEVKLQPIGVAALVRQLISENPALQPPAARIVVKEPLLQILGHEAYLTQCLTNLLTNAVKFVPAGRTPHVELWSELKEGGVRLYVKDNGIGIPSEWHGRIFGMFERMHPATHYDGTGIGLTIVRKAVERMGGQVGVESSPGEGSTFWIHLRSAAS